MNGQKISIDDIDWPDLANALGTHRASEAGAFGVELDDSAAGAMGAAMSDTGKISSDYIDGGIDRPAAIEMLKNVAVCALRAVAGIAVNSAITPVAETLKAAMPFLSKAIDAGKEFVKEKISGGCDLKNYRNSKMKLIPD